MSNAEAEWIVLAQDGDIGAFENLVNTYQRAVYNLCFRMMGSHEEAEDAAQETFLRAFLHIQRYDRQRSFSTWLLSIAAHYCIDQLRKRRMKVLSLEDLTQTEVADQSPLPEALYHLNENREKVQSLLERLSATDRAAVLMFYWYDFTYEEIAEALHLTVSAVRSRLHRARKELAQGFLNQPTERLVVDRRQNESHAL